MIFDRIEPGIHVLQGMLQGGVPIMQLGCAGRDKQKKTRHSVPAIIFFYKIYYRHNLDTYRYYFCCVQEPYLVSLGPSSLFSAPVSITYISYAFWALKLNLEAHKNWGIVGTLFAFLIKS